MKAFKDVARGRERWKYRDEKKGRGGGKAKREDDRHIGGITQCLYVIVQHRAHARAQESLVGAADDVESTVRSIL